MATMPDFGIIDVVGLQMVPILANLNPSVFGLVRPTRPAPNLIARFTSVFKNTSITGSKDESPFRGPP